jgi:hypothetical protein
VSSLLSFNKAQKSKLADVLDRRPRAAIATVAAASLPRSQNVPESAIRRANGRLNPAPAPDLPAEARAEHDPAIPSSAPLGPVSFVPSFLTKATPYVSATKEETNEVEDADDVVPNDFEDGGTGRGLEAATIAGPTSPYPTARGPYSGNDGTWERPMSPFPSSPAPGARRRNHPRDKGGGSTSAGGGFLVRRLKALRDATKADTLRLQSYGLGGAGADRHLPSSYFVMNDPRSKAESYMDLTLVGDDCWACDPQHEKVTYVAYCHNHHVRSPERTLPANSMTDRDQSAPTSSFSQTFLLLSVTFGTARERDLPTTRQLRVYNPIVVSVVKGGDEAFSAAKPAGVVAKHVVLATYLCEPYPRGLPALPAPPTFATASQVNGGLDAS